VRTILSRAKGLLEYATIFSDLHSVQEFRRVYNAPLAKGREASVSGFRLRALNGNYVFCRTPGSDINVFSDTFRRQYHLPPTDVTPIRKILDLGSNIGLTMAHFACMFPDAQILGVELDSKNVELCQRNIAAYSDRCRVIWGAVWNEPGRLYYSGDAEWGFHVTPGQESTQFVDACTMQSLIQQLGAPIDYVKMDVEGAESVLLRQAEDWIRDVRCMKIEVHEPYTVEDCVEDMRKSGFRAVVDDRRPACVIGYNPALC
jgi:FkbM family methyltransferase